MAAYVAFIFTAKEGNISYMREVADAIKLLAGSNFKRGEPAAAITALAFITERDRAAVQKALAHLWRVEERLWVLPLDSDPGPLLIDKKLMDWVRAQGR